MKFCPNCNNQLNDDASVCNYCGMQFAPQEYQQYPQQGYQQQYPQQNYQPPFPPQGSYAPIEGDDGQLPF